MKSFVIEATELEKEDEWEAFIESGERAGWRFTSASITGLKEGLVRITFVPITTKTKEQSQSELEDYIKELSTND